MTKTYRLKQRFTASRYEPGDDVSGVAFPDDQADKAGMIVEMIEPEEWQIPKWWTSHEDFEAKLEECDEQSSTH